MTAILGHVSKKIPDRVIFAIGVLVAFTAGAIFGRDDFTTIVGLIGAGLSLVWLTVELAIASRP